LPNVPVPFPTSPGARGPSLSSWGTRAAARRPKCLRASTAPRR
jgi:hypothetical protein